MKLIDYRHLFFQSIISTYQFNQYLRMIIGFQFIFTSISALKTKKLREGDSSVAQIFSLVLRRPGFDSRFCHAPDFSVYKNAFSAT